jgi:hypothetical protein
MAARISRSCVLVILIAASLGACSSSGTSAGSTTTTELNSVSIRSFVVPASVQCGRGSSTTVHIAYAVAGARSQQVIVDGRPETGTDASSATITAPIHCDALDHTVSIVAYDVFGHHISRVKHLTTVLPGPTG